MILEDKSHECIVITTYYNYLTIYLFEDDVSFEFMAPMYNLYYRDNFDLLKMSVFNKDMLAAIDLSRDDTLKLINILKDVTEARLAIAPVYSGGYHPYSNIVLEATGIDLNGMPIYTLGARAKDNITPYVVDFLGDKMFDLQYSYNELLEMIKQWEKVID